MIEGLRETILNFTAEGSESRGSMGSQSRKLLC